MRARKNETTSAVLQELTRGESTAQGIANRLETKVPKVSMTLLKLVRAGHVTRKAIHEGEIVVDADEKIVRPRYVFSYSITKKGVSRLETILASAATEVGSRKKRHRS